jgi:hypothetical protein
MTLATNTLRFRRAAGVTFEESINKTNGLTFDIDYPHTYCRLCGEVFQTPSDRNQYATDQRKHENMLRRKNWSQNHSKTHSHSEHMSLAISGLWVTADAAYKLEGFGIHAVGSAILDKSVEKALNSAPSTPQNDAEGSR